jgi:hypothetical protein
MYSQNVELGGTSVKVWRLGGMVSLYPAALLTNLAIWPLVTLAAGWKQGVPVVHGGEVE